MNSRNNTEAYARFREKLFTPLDDMQLMSEEEAGIEYARCRLQNTNAVCKPDAAVLMYTLFKEGPDAMLYELLLIALLMENSAEVYSLYEELEEVLQ